MRRMQTGWRLSKTTNKKIPKLRLFRQVRIATVRLRLCVAKRLYKLENRIQVYAVFNLLNNVILIHIFYLKISRLFAVRTILTFPNLSHNYDFRYSVFENLDKYSYFISFFKYFDIACCYNINIAGLTL